MTNQQNLHQGLSRFWTDQTEWNGFIIALSMFLVFCAFNTAQNFATSNNGNVGAISLGILYAVNTISCLIVPNVINNYISPKYAMFWGSMTYAFYVASNIKVYTIVLYMASAIEGIGAALLWIAVGVLLTQCANEFEMENNLALNSQLGYFNGIFWGVYQYNQLVGNLLAALLFEYNESKEIVYIVLSILNVIGTFTFLWVKPFDNRNAMMKLLLHSSKNGKNVKNENNNEPNTIQENVATEVGRDSRVTSISFDKDKRQYYNNPDISRYKHLNDLESARIESNSYDIVIPVQNSSIVIYDSMNGQNENENENERTDSYMTDEMENDDINHDIKNKMNLEMNDENGDIDSVTLTNSQHPRASKATTNATPTPGAAAAIGNGSPFDESKHRLMYEKYFKIEYNNDKKEKSKKKRKKKKGQISESQTTQSLTGHNDENDSNNNKNNKNDNKNKKYKRKNLNNLNISENESYQLVKSISVDPLLVVKMWFDKHFWIVLPISIYSGIMQGFEYGQFATFIDGNTNKFFSLSSFGLFDAIASYFMGKWSDKISRLYLIFIALFSHGIVYIFLFICYNDDTINIDIINDANCQSNTFWQSLHCNLIETNLYIWLILGGFLGIGDAGFNTQLFSLYPILLGDCPEAFANFNFWQSLASVWCFLWQNQVSLNTKLVSYFAVILISGVPLFGTKLARNAAKPKTKPQTTLL